MFFIWGFRQRKTILSLLSKFHSFFSPLLDSTTNPASYSFFITILPKFYSPLKKVGSLQMEYMVQSRILVWIAQFKSFRRVSPFTIFMGGEKVKQSYIVEHSPYNQIHRLLLSVLEFLDLLLHKRLTPKGLMFCL